ncbi:uncharacterized protein LOC122858588 [Aphidius gifuensis]|uniref:uncharacterized protein LOC122858588 n=1 Tax=Aphidius gifuensis TaxID=684658 RepID=UPI001CDD7BAD|nr:uncharacterized protein LOC122858588 [Aphidius gifuensis]
MSLFAEFIQLGKQIDNGIKKLKKQWESPLAFINVSDKNAQVASHQHLDNLSVMIKSIRNEVIEDNKISTDFVIDEDRFLSECQAIYDEIITQMIDIDILVEEYGYTYQNTSYNLSHNEGESSILAPELMDSRLISSPGNCTIKIEDDNDDEENYENVSPNNIVTQPKFIKTPVIKCAPSTIKPKNTTQIYDIQSTPLRSFPVEPTYSPYYYDRK